MSAPERESGARRSSGHRLFSDLPVTSATDPLEQQAQVRAEAAVRSPDPGPALRSGPGANPMVAPTHPDSGGASTKPGNNRAPVDVSRGGRPLPTRVRAFFEPRLRADLSHVRIHDDDESRSLAPAFGAEALTVGRDIYFGPGAYQPTTQSGRRLLAHELVHAGHQEMAAGPRVHRQPAWHNLPSPEGLIRTHAYNARGWRRFLQDADDEAHMRELNAFMAIAVGHPLYEQTRSEAHREQQRRLLAGLTPPPMESRVGLMIAFLTVPNQDIDLLETSPFGGPFAMTGLLLRKYIHRYYRPAIEELAMGAGRRGGVAASQIDAGNVAEFLGEAEDSLTMLRAQLSGRYGYTQEAHQEAMAEIGATGPVARHGLADDLQAEALAGAHLAAAAAMGRVFHSPEHAASIGDDAERRVRAHAQVLRGVIARHDQIRAANEALISGVVNAAFTAAGPLTAGLKGFASVVAGIAKDTIKDATMNCAKALAGKSGDELRSRARQDFYVGIQELENAIRQEHGEGPGYTAVHQLANDLTLHFHVGTD